MKTYLLEEWGGKVTRSPEGGRLVLRELEPRDSATISCIVTTSIDTVKSVPNIQEEKAKVVAASWDTELIQFYAALEI